MHHITDQMNTSHHTHHHNRIHEHTHSSQREETKKPSVSHIAQKVFSSKEHARPFISPTQRHIQQKLLTQGLSSTAILFICENEEKSLNGCNIATAIHRMAKNFQHDGRYLSEPEQEYITSLCSSKIEEFKSQEVANILWAFATLGIQKEALFDELTTRALQISGSFNSQNVANTLWAFATLDIQNEALFNKLAERALQISGSFKSQEITNTLWAFAITETQSTTTDRFIESVLERFNEKELKESELVQMYFALKQHRYLEYSHKKHSKKHEILDALESKVRKVSHSSSRMQRDLWEFVKSARPQEDWKLEYFSQTVGYHLDIASSITRTNIEIDGPSHFLSDGHRRPADAYLDKVKKHHDWRVIHLDIRGKSFAQMKEELNKSLS